MGFILHPGMPITKEDHQINEILMVIINFDLFYSKPYKET